MRRERGVEVGEFVFTLITSPLTLQSSVIYQDIQQLTFNNTNTQTANTFDNEKGVYAIN